MQRGLPQLLLHLHLLGLPKRGLPQLLLHLCLPKRGLPQLLLHLCLRGLLQLLLRLRLRGLPLLLLHVCLRGLPELLLHLCFRGLPLLLLHLCLRGLPLLLRCLHLLCPRLLLLILRRKRVLNEAKSRRPFLLKPERSVGDSARLCHCHRLCLRHSLAKRLLRPCHAGQRRKRRLRRGRWLRHLPCICTDRTPIGGGWLHGR